MKYKRLMRVLLRELLKAEPDYDLIEQIVFRYAYKSKYLINKNFCWILTRKGRKLLKEKD